MFTSRTLGLTALAVSAAYQVLAIDISMGCTFALNAVIANPGSAACLNAESFLTLMGTRPNSSVIAPLNGWLPTICGALACSNATLAAVFTNVTQGCPNELTALGFLPTNLNTTIIQRYYPTARRIVCLKEEDTLCVTQTLTNIENEVGDVNVTTVIKDLVHLFDLRATALVKCTNCVKAAYSVIKTDFPSVTSGAPAIQSMCGFEFTDGKTPDTIHQSAITASASPSSGALGDASTISHAVISALGVSSIFIISSAFALLA